jgi:hypothetical protein
MAWFYLIYFVVALVISFAMQPKPQSQKPAGIGDIQAPTAEEGREIAVLFGTREITGPNIVWYGDLRVVALKKKGGKK